MIDLELLLTGIFFFVLGLPALIWPYESARLGEQLDAIGSSRRLSEVEPAGWRIFLMKLFGVVSCGGGAVASVLSLV